MKKDNLYVLLVAAALLAGCKKYLEKEPDNRTVISSADQITQLLTTAYPKANYILFCEAMSDNAEDKNGAGTGIDYIDRINRQAYRYEEIQATPEDVDSPDFYWSACYKAIASANLALEKIESSPDKNQLMGQKGEALLARAYAHFMLVTLFSKAYDPATAASDPGIPYVIAPEKVVLAQYERKTVAYVYDMIEKDLKEGYPLIDEKIYGTATKFHFNKQAAAVFATRFYLFKRDYNSVINFGAQALTGLPANNIRPWNTTLDLLQYNDLKAEYAKATLRGNLLLQETRSEWANGSIFALVRFGIGTNVHRTIFNNTNVTGTYYTYTAYGTPDVYNIPKFLNHFVKESLNATTGASWTTVVLLSAEEVLLNRAEAHMRLNNRDAALEDINAWASKNIDAYTISRNVTAKKAVDFYSMPSDTSGAIINTILDFKKAFFLLEGLRWFDILRLKIPVTHTTASNEVIVLGPEDKRRVLQLPILTKQAGLEPNPR